MISAQAFTDDNAASETSTSSDRAQQQRLLPRLQIDDLLLAAKHLPERERALVRAVYERGLPLKALAVATDMRAGRLYHRLRRIVARLRSPLFRTVLREMPGWPPVRRGIAEMIILHGVSQRTTAAALNLSLHRVRIELERIRALAEQG